MSAWAKVVYIVFSRFTSNVFCLVSPTRSRLHVSLLFMNFIVFNALLYPVR